MGWCLIVLVYLLVFVVYLTCLVVYVWSMLLLTFYGFGLFAFCGMFAVL